MEMMFSVRIDNYNRICNPGNLNLFPLRFSARATNNVIKDNINDLVLEVKPEIEKAMTTIIEQLIIKTIYNIPYDKLYPLKD